MFGDRQTGTSVAEARLLSVTFFVIKWEELGVVSAGLM